MGEVRQRCGHTIEGPNGAAPGERLRPWWRRQCKRLAEAGSDRCWQHRRPA